MKVCIVGAGAIGGLLGAKLALAGEDVTLIARGAHLDAIKNNGLKLIMQDATEYVASNTQTTGDLAQAGPQDVVILAVKAHQIEPIAADLRALFKPDTVVVTMPFGVGDKLVLPAGTLHAEGEVKRRMVYIVAMREPSNLEVLLRLRDPSEAPAAD